MTVDLGVQVALVGAPNVGKSSLVNVLSSGVPEVCDYPFTTRSVKMGHFFINGHRHQVNLHTLTTRSLKSGHQHFDGQVDELLHSVQPVVEIGSGRMHTSPQPLYECL